MKGRYFRSLIIFRNIDKLNTVIRVFSSRKATETERNQYEGYKNEKRV